MSTIAPVSDFRLQALAEEPAEDLFPMLNSSAAFTPWIIVLAFLPALAGAFYWTLDERTAEWGLRALDASSPGLQSVPGQRLADVPLLSGAPPLATWLTGPLLRSLHLPLPLGLTVVSYLAVALTILFAAKLSHRIGVPRLAWLTVLCCASSPLLLNSAHVASPEALGLCLLTISLERFLAHLDNTAGHWSGRLLASALAWGGCWMAIGWPALTLGVVLTIHAAIFADPRGSAQVAEFPAVSLTPMQVFRRSLIPWWIVGLATGTWWLWGSIREFGLASTTAWQFDPMPNAISPLFPFPSDIGRWGLTVGLIFLPGWIVLGWTVIFDQPSKVLRAAGEGRGILILLWWIALLICRLATAAAGADPTLWDVLQVVPACLTAALGMEGLMQRSVSATGLMLAIAVALLSLSIEVPRLEFPELRTALALGGMALLVPMFINLTQYKSFHWNEGGRRRLLRGLLISTWVARLVWSISQSVSASEADIELNQQLAKISESLPNPGAVIVVSQTAPPRALEFQLRRTWPKSPYLTADRWEAAISKSLNTVENWADAEFLVIELAHRDSQFRRPGTGWIVTTVGEPRRYLGQQLTLHRVSIHSP